MNFPPITPEQIAHWNSIPNITLPPGAAPAFLIPEAREFLETVNQPNFGFPYASRVVCIKASYATDVLASMQQGIWHSPLSSNLVLQKAWDSCAEGETVFLVFSVKKSQRYCGVAIMAGPVEFGENPAVQPEEEIGPTPIRWIFCKDVPFEYFQDIYNPRNRGKPVTLWQDTIELPEVAGRMLLWRYVGAPSLNNILIGQKPIALHGDPSLSWRRRQSSVKAQALKEACGEQVDTRWGFEQAHTNRHGAIGDGKPFHSTTTR
ncbi:MAG: hypothetical protein M1836_002526 [Candelina mexicana]|nr:MAG: hypothetical protein M1836_002526 [Candelina mexicana]